MSAESWRTVVGASRYMVSDLGRIKSVRTERGTILKAQLNKRTGYLQHTLLLDTGKYGAKPVHRLVGEVFLGPRPAELATRHLNGNPHDNRAENLRYGTYSENMRDQVRHGRHFLASADSCRNGHEYTAENTRRTPEGARVCVTCARRAGAKSNAKIRAKRNAQRIAAGLPLDLRTVAARPPRPLPTECKWGHPMSGENLRFVNGDPKRRRCRTCEHEAVLRYQAKRRGITEYRLDVAA